MDFQLVIHEFQQQYLSGYPLIEYGIGGYLLMITSILLLKCLFSGSTRHPANFQVVKFNINNAQNSNTSQLQSLMESHLSTINNLTKKIQTLTLEYEKVQKENNQNKALLKDLQGKVFEILSKKSSTVTSKKQIDSAKTDDQTNVKQNEMEEKPVQITEQQQIKRVPPVRKIPPPIK